MVLLDVTRSWWGWRELWQMRRDVLQCYQHWREDYGQAVLVRLGPLRNAIFYSPEAAAQVLKSKASQFRRYPPTLRVLSQWNGRSVLIQEGPAWLEQRRMLSGAFRPQHLGEYSLKLMTLMLAGHDTTAAGLTWLCYFLAIHPEVAEKVAAEGRTLPEQPQLSDLSRLRYCEQVVRETLRLFPPAPTVFLRQALEPVEIAGYPLAAGTLVHLPLMTLQRDPEYFPDPLRFDPDRWTPEASAGRPEWCYFPFGGGPRVCLGQSFAMLEMTLAAALLARHYRLELREPGFPGYHLRVSLWPARPLQLLFKPREGPSCRP